MEDRLKRLLERRLLSGVLRATYMFKSYDFDKDGTVREL